MKACVNNKWGEEKTPPKIWEGASWSLTINQAYIKDESFVFRIQKWNNDQWTSSKELLIT